MRLGPNEQAFLSENHSERSESLPFKFTLIFWHPIDAILEKRIQWRLLNPNDTDDSFEPDLIPQYPPFKQSRSYYNHDVEIQVQRHVYGPMAHPDGLWMFLHESTDMSEGIVLIFDVMNRESFTMLPLIHLSIHRAAPRPWPRDHSSSTRKMYSCANIFSSLMGSFRWRRLPPCSQRRQAMPCYVQSSRDQALEQMEVKAESCGLESRPFPFTVVGIIPSDKKAKWSVSQEEAEEFASGIGASLYLLEDNNGFRNYDIFGDMVGKVMLRRVFGLGYGSILYT